MIDSDKPEPRWPAILAMLSTGLLFAVQPDALVFGPRWLPALIVSILEVPLFLAHRRGLEKLHRILGLSLTGVLTAFLLWSLGLLILAMTQHAESAPALLLSAAGLWITNVLIFATWYWRLDAGGPVRRVRLSSHHTQGAFLFPQMSRDPCGAWYPQFIDYLFLAFNTSTALSPTDTAVLGRWAKVLCMLQSCISLAIVVILAGRAVNIM